MTMLANRPGRWDGEKGAELVETSVVILMFILMTVGVIEFGRALNVYQTITNAAREGVRFAVAPQKGGSTSYPTSDEIRSVITGFLASSNLADPGSTELEVLPNQSMTGLTPCNPSVSGSPCGTRVNLSYPFSIFGFGSIRLQTSLIMRNET